MSDDERFFAWLDGELEPAEAAEMAAKVAADSELSRAAEQHRALAGQLRRAFDPIAAGPVPEHLRATIRPGADVISFAIAKRELSARSLPQWTALAATLAVGILAGTMVPKNGSAPVAVQEGRIYAASDLKQALDTQLASAPAGDVRIGLTFRDQGGRICRSFTDSASSGLACRNNGRWQLKGLFSAPEGQASDYRMAGGMDPNLAALMDATMAGQPFDETAEKKALKHHWQ